MKLENFKGFGRELCQCDSNTNIGRKAIEFEWVIASSSHKFEVANYLDSVTLGAIKYLSLLAHLAVMPKSPCNHELSIVCHCCCPSVASVICWHLSLSSVDSAPDHRFDHRNSISCTCMHTYPPYMHMNY